MGGRTEYKYLVPSTLLSRIRDDILPYVGTDPFAQNRASKEYTVRSVYYDTPHFDCYEEKADGVPERRKLRIRGYNRSEHNSKVFLEIKRKNIDRIAKSRAPVLYRNLNALFASNDVDKYVMSMRGNGEEAIDARRFLYHYYRRGLRPAVLVVYDREPFVGRFDASFRVSFDKNLRGAIFPSLTMLYDEACVERAMCQHFILEVKFFRGALPQWIHSIIRRYELPRMALSKFAMCLDAQRTLRRHSQMRSRVLSPVRSEA